MNYLIIDTDSGIATYAHYISDTLKEHWRKGLITIYVYIHDRFWEYTDVDATEEWTGDRTLVRRSDY